MVAGILRKAAEHQKRAQLKHPVRFPPVYQIQQGIFSNDIKKLRVRQLPVQLRKRIHRVGKADTVHFHSRCAEARLPERSQARHLKTMFGIR